MNRLQFFQKQKINTFLYLVFTSILLLNFSFEGFAQGTWAAKTSVPPSGRYQSFGLSASGKGYIGCGSGDAISYRDLWEYNPLINTWTQKADYPGIGFRAQTAFVVNDKIYVTCGLTQSTAQSEMYELVVLKGCCVIVMVGQGGVNSKN